MRAPGDDRYPDRRPGVLLVLLVHGPLVSSRRAILYLTTGLLFLFIVTGSQAFEAGRQRKDVKKVDSVRPPTKRRVAKVEGDIIIGALFPVHRQPLSINTSFTRQCGEVLL